MWLFILLACHMGAFLVVICEVVPSFTFFVAQVRFKYSSRPDVLVLDDVSFAASPGMMVRSEGGSRVRGGLLSRV